jgi:acyl-CoA dehydrogenase
MRLIVFDDDFRDILAATRHFVRAVIVPRESEFAEGDRVPDDIRDQAKAMGLFGYAIPQEWGGLGLDVTQDVELALEFASAGIAVSWLPPTRPWETRSRTRLTPLQTRLEV